MVLLGCGLGQHAWSCRCGYECECFNVNMANVNSSHSNIPATYGGSSLLPKLLALFDSSTTSTTSTDTHPIPISSHSHQFLLSSNASLQQIHFISPSFTQITHTTARRSRRPSKATQLLSKATQTTLYYHTSHSKLSLPTRRQQCLARVKDTTTSGSPKALFSLNAARSNASGASTKPANTTSRARPATTHAHCAATSPRSTRSISRILSSASGKGLICTTFIDFNANEMQDQVAHG